MSKQPPKIGASEDYKNGLISEIKSHKRTAEHWKFHCDELDEQIRTLELRNAELEQQLAEARKDGQRIDILEELGMQTGPATAEVDRINDEAQARDGLRCIVLILPYKADKKPESLRAAIDLAAMPETKDSTI